jgi:DNA-binding LytR/AlgR family response regulator
VKSLKLTINQSLDYTENEIIINCSVIDNRLQRLIDYIRQYSFSLKGSAEGQNYNIPLESILYIDSVDGKTFLYCREKVYESKETLTSLERFLYNTPFVRISKNCIMNINALKSVRILMNHRMEANLINGEKLIITRNYMENVKRKLER